jgi:magnesium-protoporphyrin O-methyltransferase
MPCDCSGLGLDEIFNERTARSDVRRFRRHGLPKRARRLLSAIRDATPLDSATALEIGAGAGGLTITMLRLSLASAQTVDASPAFVEAARTLARENGVADRMNVVAGDFAADPAAAAEADIVVLDRVICCYPDLDALLRPAAAHSRRVLALTYPRSGWLAHRIIALINGGQALFRRRFRLHYHTRARVQSLLRAAGFEPTVTGHAGLWEILIARRAADASADRGQGQV